MSRAVERLRAIITESEAPDQTLVVVNRTEVDPIQRLLETSFAGQSVGIAETEFESEADDTVLLVREGEVVADAPLESVMDAYLLVNSDLYRTGAGGLDRWQAPSVITELDETVFELRGFPESVKEKLLLVLISRFIEHRALERGEGLFRATFQELSRLTTEKGTREVYRRLGETDLSVHVYGVPDRELPEHLNLETHTGDHRGYRESWCVLFQPPERTDRHGALVALETGRNEWMGMWTYDVQKVRRVNRVLEAEF